VDTALYFPHIRVPQTAWFSQVLLYWDGAAAIVPEGVERDEAYLGPYMAELIRAGAVELVRPDEALGRASDRFTEEFLARLEPPDGTPARRWTPVHTSKLDWSVFVELRDRGLARPCSGPGWSPWFEVEGATAGRYLAYLAGALCGLRTHLFPVTDSGAAVAALGPAGDTAARLRALRYAAVTGALPAPAGPVPVRELLSFKQDQADRLRRLKLHLDGRLADLAATDDGELRRVKTQAALQEIADEVAVLREQMTGRRWPKVALVGVGGVAAAALALASSALTGGGALALGLAVGSGVASLGGASYQAVDLVRSPRLDRRAPLVYAALAADL
jgi:hypothetical protein